MTIQRENVSLITKELIPELYKSEILELCKVNKFSINTDIYTKGKNRIYGLFLIYIFIVMSVIINDADKNQIVKSIASLVDVTDNATAESLV